MQCLSLQAPSWCLERNEEVRMALTLVGVAQRDALPVVFIPMRVAGRVSVLSSLILYFLTHNFSRGFFRNLVAHRPSRVFRSFLSIVLVEIVLFSGEGDWIGLAGDECRLFWHVLHVQCSRSEASGKPHSTPCQISCSQMCIWLQRIQLCSYLCTKRCRSYQGRFRLLVQRLDEV